MKAKAELQKISDDIPEYKPDEDVQLGGARGESQGEAPRGSSSQPGHVPNDTEVACESTGDGEVDLMLPIAQSMGEREVLRDGSRPRAMTSSTKS